MHLVQAAFLYFRRPDDSENMRIFDNRVSVKLSDKALGHILSFVGMQARGVSRSMLDLLDIDDTDAVKLRIILDQRWLPHEFFADEDPLDTQPVAFVKHWADQRGLGGFVVTER